jgi:hypothetical protein
MLRAAVVLVVWLASAGYASSLTVRAPVRPVRLPEPAPTAPEPPRDACPSCEIVT